jgi:hypothetical protein
VRVFRTRFSDVDAMNNEPGREGLHDEVVEIKWIVMQHDPTGVSHDLKHEATEHANHESPSFVRDAESKLRDQKQAKPGSIDSVPSQRG